MSNEVEGSMIRGSTSRLKRPRNIWAIAILSIVVLSAVAYTNYPTAHGSGPPLIAVGGPTNACMPARTYFTTTITSSNLTNTMSWQINITFTNIIPVNFTLGSSFSTSSGTGISAVSNKTGMYLLGFSFYNGGSPVTTLSRTTLATFTWQTTQYHAPIYLHLVTSSETTGSSTMLLDPSTTNLPFNTRDYFGCGPPNLALPDLSGHCLNTGATVVTALTASNLTSIKSWQVNVTFPAWDIVARSYTMGSLFTGSNTIVSNVTKNTTNGWFLLKFNFTNGATVTSTTQITLVTIYWKTTVYHAGAFFHIVLSTENPARGTYIWDNTQQAQPYVTTDGDVGCQV